MQEIIKAALHRAADFEIAHAFDLKECDFRIFVLAIESGLIKILKEWRP